LEGSGESLGVRRGRCGYSWAFGARGEFAWLTYVQEGRKEEWEDNGEGRRAGNTVRYVKASRRLKVRFVVST
jgi:hypothetical protein